ncbi:MAG: hypothetical protein SNJ77_00820 [Cytophagales bacterium]
MKVIKELEHQGIKITIFQWNNKYLLKYETRDFEQTYKIPQTEVFDENELVNLAINNSTLENVISNFKNMSAVLDVFLS